MLQGTLDYDIQRYGIAVTYPERYPLPPPHLESRGVKLAAGIENLYNKSASSSAELVPCL